MKNCPNIFKEFGLVVNLKSHPLRVKIELSDILSQMMEIGLHGLKLGLNVIHPLIHPTLKLCKKSGTPPPVG